MVATFSVIGDMLANVGGDHVAIKTIVGAGGDSELYQPTQPMSQPSHRARAVFLNDLNEEFEPWLEPLLKQAGFKGAKVVVTRRVHTLTAEEEHPVSGSQLPATIDQHAWLDPRNGVIYVRNIADALARLDPINAADYRARAAAYTKQIQAVDEWARNEMAGVPPAKRRALASHDSLQYIANAYGITLLTVNGWTNKSEPSAAELAKLAQQIRAERVKALFLDSITDPRAMQRIAGETGAAIGGTLYGDSLSPCRRRGRQLPQDAAPRRGHAEGRHAEQLSDVAGGGMAAPAGRLLGGGGVVGRRPVGRAVGAIDGTGAALGARRGEDRHSGPAPNSDRCAPSSDPVSQRLAAAASIGSTSPGSRSSRRSMRAVRSRSTPPCCAHLDAEGIFLAEAARITKVAAFGDAVPGGGTLSEFAAASIAGAERGGTCGVRRADRRGRSTEGVFLSGEEGLQVIALAGDDAPGVPAGVLVGFNAPALNDNDEMAFVATVRRGRDTLDVLYFWNGRRLQRLVAEGELLLRIGGTMDKIGEPALNNAGVVAFPAAILKGPVLGGIFVAGARTLRLLVGAGDRTPSGAMVLRFSERVAIDDEDAIAFGTYLGGDDGSREAVLRIGSEGLAEIAVEGHSRAGRRSLCRIRPLADGGARRRGRLHRGARWRAGTARRLRGNNERHHGRSPQWARRCRKVAGSVVSLSMQSPQRVQAAR